MRCRRPATGPADRIIRDVSARAEARASAPLRRRLGDEADAVQARLLRRADHLGDAAVGHASGRRAAALRSRGCACAAWPARGQLGGASPACRPRKAWPGLVEHDRDELRRVVRLGARRSSAGRASGSMAISGAVIMKITSSTSITSISGVMLMSLIGCGAGACARGGRRPCAARRSALEPASARRRSHASRAGRARSLRGRPRMRPTSLPKTL